MHSNVKRRDEDVFARLYERAGKVKAEVSDSRARTISPNAPSTTRNEAGVGKNSSICIMGENTWRDYKSLLTAFKQSAPAEAVTTIGKFLASNAPNQANALSYQSKVSKRDQMVDRLKERRKGGCELENVTPGKKGRADTCRQPYVLARDEVCEAIEAAQQCMSKSKEVAVRRREGHSENNGIGKSKNTKCCTEKNSFIGASSKPLYQNSTKSMKKRQILFDIDNQ